MGQLLPRPQGFVMRDDALEGAAALLVVCRCSWRSFQAAQWRLGRWGWGSAG